MIKHLFTFFSDDNSIVTLRHGKFQKMGFQYNCIWPPVYLHFATFLFSRENYMISAVLSVLPNYITCIAHTFHIDGIYNKYMDIYERKGVHVLFHAQCAYRYNKEKFVRRKMYLLALVF